MFCLMRIIAGSAKGHRLSLPRGKSIRPTTDRVREALFNILAPRIQDARFLDLYSGSGSVGLEALSRGASSVAFVDMDANSIATVMENLKRSRLSSEHAAVYKGDAIQVLAKLNKQILSFDVVFMDPPYACRLVEPTLVAIGSASLLRPGGLVIVEHCIGEEVPRYVNNLEIESVRQYGDSILSFFRWSSVV